MSMCCKYECLISLEIMCNPGLWWVKSRFLSFAQKAWAWVTLSRFATASLVFAFSTPVMLTTELAGPWASSAQLYLDHVTWSSLCPVPCSLGWLSSAEPSLTAQSQWPSPGSCYFPPSQHGALLYCFLHWNSLGEDQNFLSPGPEICSCFWNDRLGGGKEGVG